MFQATLLFLSAVAAIAVSVPISPKLTCMAEPYIFVSKVEWGGRPATSVTRLSRPVPFVVIHHSYEPKACFTFTACSQAMRSMQDFHQLTNRWVDIGYNFAVGSDGAVYEGRGWEAVGAHVTGYNAVSIGIVLIGDWVSTVPPANQLQTVKDLIADGVRLGHISSNYQLVGHRKFSATECPGNALYNEIRTWDRFTT